jgi:hypothetical protein
MPPLSITPDLHARIADALGDPYAEVLAVHEVVAMPPPRPGERSWPVPSVEARVQTSDGRHVTVVLERI